MYIESEIGRISRYSSNAIEAFRVAVDNGQARLAIQILVDVIDAYAEKFDEYDALLEEKLNKVTPQDVQHIESTLLEEVKEQTTETNITEEVKNEVIQVETPEQVIIEPAKEVVAPTAKNKTTTKENQIQK